MADVCYYIYNLKMDVISVLIFLFVAAGNYSMRLSNLCDKTKNDTCRYIWQGAVGNQHICSYCPHELLNDENSKNHQCIQNNVNKRDPFEIKNDLFPYCYSNVPGAIVPSCGKLPNVTYGVWDCGNYISPHNVTVYYTCKLICDHQSASVQNVTVVRCNESRKWNSSLDTLSCVNSHLEPDIHDHTEDVDSNEATVPIHDHTEDGDSNEATVPIHDHTEDGDSNEATVPIHDHTEDGDSNEAKVPKELVTILLLLLIFIVTTGMVIIAILLVYFLCRNIARNRRQTLVLRNHDNTSSPKTHEMTNGCSPVNDDIQGSNNPSGENIALLQANKSLPPEMKFCDSQERSHNENSDEDHQSDHNHYKTYVVEKDSSSFGQSKTNMDEIHVTTESEYKEDQERSNNHNGNEDHQSADTNDPESIYASQGAQSDHNQHKTYNVERTSPSNCQDSLRFENEQSITVRTEPEHKKDDQSLENMNELLNSYHGMRLSSLMGLNSES